MGLAIAVFIAECIKDCIVFLLELMFALDTGNKINIFERNK